MADRFPRVSGRLWGTSCLGHVVLAHASTGSGRQWGCDKMGAWVFHIFVSIGSR